LRTTAPRFNQHYGLPPAAEAPTATAATVAIAVTAVGAVTIIALLGNVPSSAVLGFADRLPFATGNHTVGLGATLEVSNTGLFSAQVCGFTGGDGAIADAAIDVAGLVSRSMPGVRLLPQPPQPPQPR
jgi:hypothetical protein